MIQPRLRVLLFTVTGVVMLSVGAYFGFTARDAGQEPVEINGVVLNVPRPLPDFQLIDGAGEVFSSESFPGVWSFVYFGYTYCPDVCPLSLVEMATVKRNIEMANRGVEHRYVLVSVDPDRDTPERMGEYVSYFDADFIGVTGDAEQIRKFATTAGIAYHVPEDRNDPDYLVGHSSVITLVDPEGRVAAYFTAPLDGGTIASDFLRLIR